jgi:hypothetical protein
MVLGFFTTNCQTSPTTFEPSKIFFSIGIGDGYGSRMKCHGNINPGNMINNKKNIPDTRNMQYVCPLFTA